jgi:Tol biopolymer transport system component
MLAAAVALQLVFVHANGRVALERKPGDATYVLFDKGREPSRAPDGKRIYYWTDAGIVWADVDGGARGLWRAGNLRSPRVSPDGTQLIWGEMVGGQWAVMRSPIDNKNGRVAPTLVYRGRDGVYQPMWLPDGRGIIVHDLDNVYWVALDGKVTRTMATHELAPEGGSSSAERYAVCPTDDQRLVYSVEVGEDESALWLYDLATKKRTRLTPPGVLAMDPSWSRDGRFVYFRGWRKGKAPLRDGVLKIAADGSGLVRVSPGSEPSP